MKSTHEISTVINIDEISQVGEARRMAASISKQLNFNETDSGKVGIIVTEAANNIIKHAVSGQIIIRNIPEKNGDGIEIISVDKGPGIYDMRRCMEDGYSTAGSPGTGMGAMNRLSSKFDISSVPGKGTVIVSQLFPNGFNKVENCEIGGVCVPVVGERECGDGWAFYRDEKKTAIMAVDGLGHGPLAASATDEAIRVFSENQGANPVDMMRILHGALFSTRGAAIAISVIDHEKEKLHFVGVGNITGILFDGEKNRGLPSFNGTVGHQLHKIQEITYNWPKNGWLIMHSDGLYSRWKLEDYPGLIKSHSSIIAGTIYRDFQRGRDDSMVIMVKDNR